MPTLIIPIIHIEITNGRLTIGGVPARGPETEEECAEEWRELQAKEAREESELLAERLEM